jgi:hypothetical protein
LGHAGGGGGWGGQCEGTAGGKCDGRSGGGGGGGVVGLVTLDMMSGEYLLIVYFSLVLVQRARHATRVFYFLCFCGGFGVA